MSTSARRTIPTSATNTGPGHADYAYDVKYGLRDYRGGGRQSARETAMRVAAGAIARKIVPGMTVRAALIQMGPETIDRARWDWDEVDRNPFFCPDAQKAKFFETYLDGIRKNGSSVGAVIEVVAEGVPAGLGAPVYGKLDGDLAAAMMGINAVKGVEIGAGMGAAALTGEENGDEMRMGNDGKPMFLSNHAGGILGGISTGQPIVVRFAVKPTSSILHRAAHRRPLRRRDRDQHQGPPRSLRRHPRGADRRGDDGVRGGGSLSAAARAGGRKPGLAVREAAQLGTRRTVDEIHLRVEAAIAAFAKGEIVVVTDDDDRENEGDLFVAASLCTPDKMAFIIRNTSGIVCAPLASEEAKRLHLDPMVALNDAPLGTAFTVSVDVRHGLTTGISAEERNNTVRALANGNSGANDFVRPGHVFPLVAQRRRRADALRPYRGLRRPLPARRAAAGRRARRTDERRRHRDARARRSRRLPRSTSSSALSIADLIAYRQVRDKLVKRVGEFPVKSEIGTLTGYAYVTPFDNVQHMAFVHGRIGDGENVLARLHRPTSSATCSAAPIRSMRCCASSRPTAAACWSSCATARPACRRMRSRRPARPIRKRRARGNGARSGSARRS